MQPQPAQAEDGPARETCARELARTAGLLAPESFPAVAGDHCRDCSFVPLCPIKSAGR